MFMSVTWSRKEKTHWTDPWYSKLTTVVSCSCDHPFQAKIQLFWTVHSHVPYKWLFTGRNEVLAKVIFLHLCVILFTGGGVPDQACPPGTRHTPPDQAGTPPPDQAGTPLPPRPGRYTPRTRYTPPGPGRCTPRDQAGTPPLGPGTPPPRKQQTPEYGQRSAGTHPTGMHSSCHIQFAI